MLISSFVTLNVAYNVLVSGLLKQMFADFVPYCRTKSEDLDKHYHVKEVYGGRHTTPINRAPVISCPPQPHLMRTSF